MESVDLPNVPGGAWNKVNAWTSFVVDTRTSKVYSVANGGHADYSGNEVDALELERDDPRWVEVLASTPPGSRTDCASYYADGRPTSRHTYYGVTLNEFDDRIMLFAGVRWCGAGSDTNAISSYNIGANAYSPSTTHGTTDNGSGGAVTADPFTGDVYSLNLGIARKWTRSSNTFGPFNPSGANPYGYYTMSAFDTSRNRISYLGGQGNAHHLYTLSNNTFTTFTLSGANAGNVAGIQAGGMIYVPEIDSYLVRRSQSGSTVYQINASTFEATTLATIGGSSIPVTLNGPYNKFLYVPRLRGAVYVPDYGANAWFLRLH